MKKNKLILLSLIIGTTLISNKINEKQEVKAANDTYSLVTDATTLKDGDIIVLGSSDNGAVAGNISGKFLSSIETTFVDNMIESLPENAIEFTLSKDSESNNWIFLNNEQKLCAKNVKNLSWENGTYTWSISISNEKAAIESTKSSYGKILYNVGSPRFLNYASDPNVSMVLPEIYKKDSEKTLSEKFVDVKTNTNLKFNYTKSNSNLVTESIDFTKQKYENEKEITSYDGTNYKISFNKGDNSIAPKYYTSGSSIRVYAKNTITINSINDSKLNNVKLLLATGGKGNSITMSSGKLVNIDDSLTKQIIDINSTTLTLTIDGTTGHIRIQQIIINEQEVTYSNFNNLQIQYQYSFDVSSYTEVQEVGIFVTDDEKFNFYTDGTYDEETPFEIGLTTGTKGHKFVNSNKKETYTVGVNLGNDIEGAILTTFRAGTYIKIDNKYYFSNYTSKYNLKTMLEEYSKLTLEGEGNAIVDSFLSYVNNLYEGE